MTALTDFFSQFKFLGAYAPLASLFVALTGTIVLAVLSNLVAKNFIVALINRLLHKSTSKRDDILARRKVFERLSQLAPALVIYALAPYVLSAYPAPGAFIAKLSLITIVVIGVLFIDALINAGLEIYGTYRASRNFPIKSFAQAAKLMLYFLGAVSTLSLILGQSPMTFIAGFGAFAAVLMFVFKDPILGFVAGLQLSANRMVAVGDWIEMPKYGIDGDVMEIALTTVKIRNFDKTITTVPTQALINDSFKNWRGMTETGGRRIKRSIYLDEKRRELTTYNETHMKDPDALVPASLVNGRRLTNVGTFRAYLEAYLRAHPKISKTLTLLVRQLQPTENGLPIEIYVFSTQTDWGVYESIQADIFDHILAAAPEFDLRIFQNPTGGDFARLGG